VLTASSGNEATDIYEKKREEIALDSELNINNVTHGSDPMFCLPIVTLAKTKEPSIVDIF
jgi:hypothetical protein